MFRLFGKEAEAPVVVTPPTPPVAQVTTAVFEKKEEAVKVTPVVEEVKAPVVPVVEKKEPEVTSEEDDTTEAEVVDTQSTHADDVDVSTVTSEPEYVNVSLKKEGASLETPEETPKEVKEVIPEPLVVKEKVKPASWACLFAGGTPEPAPEAPKPKKMPPVKKEGDSDKPASAAATKPTPGPPQTVYLCQLPENVVESEVRALFEPFGNIKKIDIHVHKGFAFVDFADASAVKNAMTKKGTGYFTIRDTPIQVEERQTKVTGMGAKNGNNNRNGRVAGGRDAGGNRRTEGGQKKQGDNRDKGGNNNTGNRDNRNKTGHKTGANANSKPSAAK